LHIGDTGYRFVVASEPCWQEYIDQAAEMGATKIRTWFAMDRGTVDALFTANGKDPALFYWKEIERRILILEFRQKAKHPVVLDEDRYELYRYPMHRRYYFRRLLWASLLSGGHATYGGLKTYLPYEGQNYAGPESSVAVGYEPFGGLDQGVSGYFDANRKGMLHQGAHDFRQIHAFFKTSGITLVNMLPNDALVGNDSYRWKCVHNENIYIIYLSNPSGTEPGTDYPKTEVPEVKLQMPKGNFSVKWFDPDTGAWYYDNNMEGGEELIIKAPGIEDWILVLEKL
jgi:hypothetical protein